MEPGTRSQQSIMELSLSSSSSSFVLLLYMMYSLLFAFSRRGSTTTAVGWVDEDASQHTISWSHQTAPLGFPTNATSKRETKKYVVGARD